MREEVYRLQARVDMLEQVRLGWEWVLLASTDQSLELWFQIMGWLRGRVVRMVMGKGCKDAGFLNCDR